MNPIRTALIAALLAPATAGLAQDPEDSPWADFIQPDFPFFGHTLDARKFSEDAGLTPRGLLFQIGDGVWGCFDPDLLRVSLIWREDEKEGPITLGSMAPGSYHNAGRKSGGGQGNLPTPLGDELFSTGVHPGWHVGEAPKNLDDPRPEPADAAEVGRGPIDPKVMRFTGLRTDGFRFLYEVGGAEVSDSLILDGDGHMRRQLQIGASEHDLYLAVGKAAEGWSVDAENLVTVDDQVFVHFPASTKPRDVAIHLVEEGKEIGDSMRKAFSSPIWEEVIETNGELAADDAPYVLDVIDFPADNPWKRNVRLAGIDFFDDGSAALCTFDGDVWLVNGIDTQLKNIKWKRFASGLNEPMSLQIVDGEIYVFGRTCVWRLRDENDDGVADFYENFSNIVGQTAETREFANDMIKIPDGGFYIAKPGQLATTRGHHNGTICKISADGRSYEIVASGFRQPFIGLDSKSGTLTASDQQGNWVPTTPLHVIDAGNHYGFLPPMEKAHSQSVTPAMVWVPHFVNQSGATQVTVHDKRWGPLAGELMHFGFNRPEFFRVYRDDKQGAIASFMRGFGTGPLKSAVNPKDGQLYVSGFKIWGTVAKDVCGFYRIRYTGKGDVDLPRDLRSSKEGVLLKFDFELDPTIATFLPNYKLDRWNYKRTSGYGSGHFKLDGSPGQENLQVSSAYLSEDKKSVFIGVPDMQPCETLRLTYRLPKATETPQIKTVFLTVHELKTLDLAKLGFGDLEVDLTPPAAAGAQVMAASVEEGERLYTAVGCMACHTNDGKKVEGISGPTWLGLYGSRRDFEDGSFVKKADEVYLRESILDPDLQTTKGYDLEEGRMPSYLGVLQDYQIDSLILYIKSLAKKK
ncbi:MAG: DUF6797 domain-containing protein [Verrucomicrobiota bacterium]